MGNKIGLTINPRKFGYDVPPARPPARPPAHPPTRTPVHTLHVSRCQMTQ